MNDLDCRAQAIVEAARDADQPSPVDRDRIKRAVLIQLAAGAVATSAAAGTVAAGMSVGTKVGLAVLAVSLVGGGTVGVLHWKAPSRLTHVSDVAKSETAERSATHSPAVLPMEIPAVAGPPDMVPAQSESRARKSDRPRKLAGQASAEVEKLAEDDQLNSEVAVLKRAREELRLGRPVQALEALREYDRRFGKGALGEERQAIAAIAACQAHPGPRSLAQARDFMRASPTSPLRDRVRAACITPDGAKAP